jgi:hypothetical protein
MISNDFGTSTTYPRRDKRIPIISSRGDNKNTNSDSGMSKYIAKAFDDIRKIERINVVLTSMGTHRKLRKQLISKKY